MAYELKKTRIETLKDLCDLLVEVFDLTESAYGGSPNDSGTPWTALRYGAAHAVEAREEFTKEELARPYDFEYFPLEQRGEYDYAKIHPDYHHFPCHANL